MNTLAWKPVLDRGARQGAIEAIRSLAQDLAGGTESSLFPLEELTELGFTSTRTAITAASLAQGHAGIALFYGELARFSREGEWLDAAAEQMNRAIDQASGATMGNTLYEGFPGFLFSAVLLDKIVPESCQCFEDIGGEQAEALSLASLEDTRQGQSFELLFGLAGLGVYFLTRPGSDLYSRALRAILSRMGILARREQQLISWFIPPEILSGKMRDLYPSGYCNLGMAHGDPGAIAFLAKLYKAGFEREEVSSLLRRSVAWLLEQRLSNDEGSFFPEVVAENVEPHASRLRWCYGDLPIAVSLWMAGVCLDVPEWRRVALDTFVKASERPLKEAGTTGPGLCHGLASVAHIFNRAYQATGEGRLKEASRRWFRALLECRDPGTGIGGWTYEMSNFTTGKPLWRYNPGLLNGACGVGLALLAAVSDVEPMWDRCMLLDMPPCPM
ncbi:MAG: lanthionine synthetase C family protein [Acidobacteriota bacterium]